MTALGRLQPKDGIIRVAGPSRPTVVIAKLLVDTGDVVEAGQPLAILDTQHDGGRAMEIRIPIGTGIVGEVVRTGQALKVADAYASPFFNPDVDRASGFRTRSVLAVPILDRNRCPYALMSLLNKVGAQTSDARDERALQVFAASIGVILDTWNETGKARRLRPAIAS